MGDTQQSAMYIQHTRGYACVYNVCMYMCVMCDFISTFDYKYNLSISLSYLYSQNLLTFVLLQPHNMPLLKYSFTLYKPS